MSGSTVTATTATAESTHIGRFAPSPTGPLHLGSLTTALASRLEALRHRGRWLLRIEDLDRGRSRPHFADHQRRTLQALGFRWDAELVQSSRGAAHAEALAQLSAHTYRCRCTRRELAALRSGTAADLPPELLSGYPGTCRTAEPREGPAALRLRLDQPAIVEFQDLLQGAQRADLTELGDPVLRNRDGAVSYQLAVVVDDYWQGVNCVVRGADLLPSTAWQIRLQQLLHYPQPRYLHLPLVTEADGRKLSKSAHALPLQPSEPSLWLWRGLSALRQSPPDGLRLAAVGELWNWAEENWDINRLRGISYLESASRHT